MKKCDCGADIFAKFSDDGRVLVEDGDGWSVIHSQCENGHDYREAVLKGSDCMDMLMSFASFGCKDIPLNVLKAGVILSSRTNVKDEDLIRECGL